MSDKYKLTAEDRETFVRWRQNRPAGYMARVSRALSIVIDRALADLDTAHQEIAELTARAEAAEVKLARWEEWEDGRDEWSDAVSFAHPTRSGEHETWDRAMAMVGVRHSKGSLVGLVNCLLIRIDDMSGHADRWRDDAIQTGKQRDAAKELAKVRAEDQRRTGALLDERTRERDAAVQRAEKAERDLALMVEAEAVEVREAARLEAIVSGLREHSDALVREAMGADGIEMSDHAATLRSRTAARKALLNLVRWYDAGLVAGDPPMSLFESARAMLAGTPGGEVAATEEHRVEAAEPREALLLTEDEARAVAAKSDEEIEAGFQRIRDWTDDMRARLPRPDAKTSEDGEDHGVAAPLPGTNVAPASAPKSGDPSGLCEHGTPTANCYDCLASNGLRDPIVRAAYRANIERRGRAAEREEIVAWLRSFPLNKHMRAMANDIEQRGDAGAKGGG